MDDGERYPSERQQRFIVRMPDGMRERIKIAAERNGRSMNAEIVARLDESFLDAVRLPDDLRVRIESSANNNQRSVSGEVLQVLNQYFPPEPSVYELLDSIDMFVRWSKNPSAPPYKRPLIDAIRELQWRLERGIEFDPTEREVLSPEEADRREGWRKQFATIKGMAAKTEQFGGVNTEDFKKAIDGGFLSRVSLDRKESALEELENGHFDRCMSMLGLSKIAFKDRDEVERLLVVELTSAVKDVEF